MIERTTMGELLENNKGVTNYCKDGKCSQCGSCCTDNIAITQKEINVIKKYIKRHNIKEHTFAKPNEVVWDMTCPFLTDASKCAIYPVRPLICRVYLCCYSDEEIKRILMKKENIKQAAEMIGVGSMSMRRIFYPKQVPLAKNSFDDILKSIDIDFGGL